MPTGSTFERQMGAELGIALLTSKAGWWAGCAPTAEPRAEARQTFGEGASISPGCQEHPWVLALPHSPPCRHPTFGHPAWQRGLLGTQGSSFWGCPSVLLLKIHPVPGAWTPRAGGDIPGGLSCDPARRGREGVMAAARQPWQRGWEPASVAGTPRGRVRAGRGSYPSRRQGLLHIKSDSHLAETFGSQTQPTHLPST